MAGFLRCFAAPRAVHNLGDPSIHPRLSWEKSGDSSEDSTAGQGAGSCDQGFGTLPNHLLERIFAHLEPASRLTRYSVCGVSRSWRLVGRHLFFSSPWSEAQPISHPSQLFCLSPLPVTSSRSGLLKCFVRRERLGGGGFCFGGKQGTGLSRYCLYLGRDCKQQHRAHFLMCAVQVSRSEMLIYLNRDGRGFPAARLCATNTICTRYTLGLAHGVRLLGQSLCELGHRQVKYAPQEQGTVEYQAKLEGFMQPRRVEVCLTRPGELEFGQVLPTLCRQGGDLEASYHGESSYLARSSYIARSPPDKPLPAWGHSMGSSAGGAYSLAAAAAAAGAGAGAAEGAGPGEGAAVLGEAVGGSRGQQQQQGEVCPGGGTFRGGSGGAAEGSAGSGSGEMAGGPVDQPEGEGDLEGTSAEQAQRAEQAQQAVVLRNKPPEWNADMRAWVLNFNGRVKKASVKNFQLIREGDESLRTVLQFGKVERDLYIMDWDPTVVTAFQSFAISLSTFDGKFLL